jgi:cytidine deaminase
MATEKQILEERIERAKQVSRRAYCPYSRFPVGAVVVSSSGREYVGCNVENASYGLSLCAERNAIVGMIADNQLEIRQVIIYTPTPKPSAPCGACRQIINEFGSQAHILSVCDGVERLDTTLDLLLPAAFGPSNLNTT